MAFKKGNIQFNLDSEDLYYYEAFKGGNVEANEVRAEYSRLRQAANKRLERMKGTKYEKSQTFIRNAGKFTSIDEITAKASETADRMNLKGEKRKEYIDSHIAHKLHDVYKFLNAKTSSIRGMQRVENELVKSLRDRGLTFINKDNIQQFGEYMENLRIMHQGRIFDSERAADLFGVAYKKGINPQEISKDFAYWMENAEKLEQTPKIQNANRRTAAEYKKQLERD